MHLAPSLKARVWAEAVAIPVIAIAAAFVVSPRDPFLVNATFPWLWFAPVLVALRYGLAPAVLSLAILVVSFVAARLGLPALHIHRLAQGQFLGGIMLTLLAGEYGSLWILRLRRSEQMSAYATQQLEALTRTLHMTRLSHDRLEQTIIGKPVLQRIGGPVGGAAFFTTACDEDVVAVEGEWRADMSAWVWVYDIPGNGVQGRLFKAAMVGGQMQQSRGKRACERAPMDGKFLPQLM